VQGCGNVGAGLARMLAERGAVVVAISDSQGGLHAPNGLDMPAALAHKAEHGTFAGFRGGDALTNEELVLVDCDLLAPCALEQVITRENAAQVKARVICEGANGPVTPEADEILEDRGVIVLPDVLANAGGVVVSYFEWVQGLQEYFWKEEEVNERLNDIVTRAFREAWDTHKERGTSLRIASYGIGVRRVAEATVTRGLYP
jgi:glutamate dehydrogenase/leucine dehydrogenase